MSFVTHELYFTIGTEVTENTFEFALDPIMIFNYLSLYAEFLDFLCTLPLLFRAVSVETVSIPGQEGFLLFNFRLVYVTLAGIFTPVGEFTILEV